MVDVISDLHLEYNEDTWRDIFKSGGKYLIVAGDLCEVRNAHLFNSFSSHICSGQPRIIIRELCGERVTFLQDDFREFPQDRLVVPYGQQPG